MNTIIDLLLLVVNHLQTVASACIWKCFIHSKQEYITYKFDFDKSLTKETVKCADIVHNLNIMKSYCEIEMDCDMWANNYIHTPLSTAQKIYG
jgi:hypothetical protein